MEKLEIVSIELVSNRVDRYGAQRTTYRVEFSDGVSGRGYVAPGWTEFQPDGQFYTQIAGIDDKREAPHVYALHTA